MNESRGYAVDIAERNTTLVIRMVAEIRQYRAMGDRARSLLEMVKGAESTELLWALVSDLALVEEQLI